MLKLNAIKWLKNEDPEYVLDSLTGVISRHFICKIAQGLVADNVPFTMIILDLDNFKSINDSYGHLSGDFILKTVGRLLVKYYAGKIYVGRYGGDELLLLLPNITEYDDVHKFLEGLYEKDKIFRRYYNDAGRDIYLTATSGCASFPADGRTYNEVFNKADKALYRGKTKGRNCYIIYVHDKHKNIVIREKADGSAVERFNSAVRLFDIYKNENNIIKFTLDYLYSELHCSGAYFLTPEGKIYSNKDDNYKTTGYLIRPHIEMLLKDDKVFYETPLTKYKAEDPILRDFLESRAIQSILIVRLETFNLLNGFILIYENEITRVWQENEVTLVMYVSALLELQLSYRKKGI